MSVADDMLHMTAAVSKKSGLSLLFRGWLLLAWLSASSCSLALHGGQDRSPSALLTPSPLVAKADDDADNGRCVKAFFEARTALRHDTDQGAAYDARGLAEMCMGRDKDAERDFHTALRLRPRYIGPYFNLSQLARKHNDMDTAEAIDRIIMSTTPDRVAGNLGKGITFGRDGDIAHALYYLAMLDDSVRDRAESKYWSAHYIERSGHYHVALALVTDAIRIDPTFLASYSERAFIESLLVHDMDLFDIRQDPPPLLQQAIADASFVAGNPDEALSALHSRCYAYRQMGRFHEALTDALGEVRSDPHWAQGYDDVVISAGALGLKSVAYDALKKEFALEPGDMQLIERAAQTELRFGDTAEAFRNLRYLSRRHYDPSLVDLISGTLFLSIGNGKAASAILDRARDEGGYAEATNLLMLARALEALQTNGPLPRTRTIMEKFLYQQASVSEAYATLATMPAHENKDEHCFVPYAIGIMELARGDEPAAFAALQQAASARCEQTFSQASASTALILLGRRYHRTIRFD